MSAISAALVKELRERTSAGMMDCKKALEETGGNMEAAIDYLRSKGLSKAAKKAGRATSEGLIGINVADDCSLVTLVEVKCETDFVARGDDFQALVQHVVGTGHAKNPADSAALLALVEDEVNQRIATLGENISVGRFVRMAVGEHGVIGSYVHSTGKIAALVEIACEKAETAKKPELLELAKNISMHIAATHALALDADSLDPELVEREREVILQKTVDSGKPASVVEKIVEGSIRKFYQEVCLLEQAYIRDDKLTIKALLQAEGKKLGDTLRIVRFVRLQLGEGEEA